MLYSSILHIDLMDTDINDFAEHFRRNIDKIVSMFAIQEATQLHCIRPTQIFWNVSQKIVWDNARSIGEAHILTGDVTGADIVVMIDEFRFGTTECYWRAGWEPKTARDWREIIHENDDIEQWEQNVLDMANAPRRDIFLMSARRFHRSRLKIILSVPQADDVEARQPFMEWLETRWGKRGDGYLDFDPNDAPEPSTMLPARPAGRRPDSWNARAIERLMAGEQESSVRAEWQEDYKNGTGSYPSETEDGEVKTWQKRVWDPYRRRKGAE